MPPPLASWTGEELYTICWPPHAMLRLCLAVALIGSIRDLEGTIAVEPLAGSWYLGGALALVMALQCPAWAQSPEDLDALTRSGEVPNDGLALARSQVATGALLEALATLERTLALKPKDKQAKLLHASILCRIDDPAGAAVEFGRLKAKDFKKADWAEAQVPCTAPAQATQR